MNMTPRGMHGRDGGEVGIGFFSHFGWHPEKYVLSA
jgi:hypothetical protein